MEKVGFPYLRSGTVPRTADWLTATGLLVCVCAQAAGREETVAKTAAQAGGRPAPGVPLGTEPRVRSAARYRFQAGRWWFLSRDNQWFYWTNGRWTAYSQPRAGNSPDFDRRFADYQNYQAGQRRLQTAEGGQAELATDEIAEPGDAAEAVDMGGISRRESERRRLAVGRAVQEQQADWFNAGSPFGTRYGYGSSFGYGGYGYNNPYGYGPRTGSGGGFSFGFGPYGAVGGQTGSRMNGMGGGPSLIGLEQGGLGPPSQIEKGPVGGSDTRPARHKLGGSAASSGGRD